MRPLVALKTINEQDESGDDESHDDAGHRQPVAPLRPVRVADLRAGDEAEHDANDTGHPDEKDADARADERRDGEPVGALSARGNSA
jgi:hypothetical protein